MGELRVSALGLIEETVKLAAGGVKGALLVFPAVVDGCWGSMERKTGLRLSEFCKIGCLARSSKVSAVPKELSPHY